MSTAVFEIIFIMLSVRHFKTHDKKTLHSSCPIKQRPDSIFISPMQKRIHQLLAFSLDPAKKMQDCREVFQAQVQSSSDRCERKTIIDIMQSSLNDCFQLLNIEAAIDASQKTIAFITKYNADELLSYSWLAASPHANVLSVSIIDELTDSFTDVCWDFFCKLHQQKNITCYPILQDILTALLNSSGAHLDLAFAYLALIENISLKSTINHAYLETQIDISLKKAETQIRFFYSKLTHYAINYGIMLYHPERMLFFAYATKAKLEIQRNHFDLAHECIEKASIFIKKYAKTAQYKQSKPDPVRLLTQLRDAITQQKAYLAKSVQMHTEKEEASRQKTKANKPLTPTTEITTNTPPATPPIDVETIATSTIEQQKPILNYKQREAERKRLKKRKKEACDINLLPTCYTSNPHLKLLIDQIHEIFKNCLIEGYLFGSSHYKQYPGDFDILLPNIKTNADKAHVIQLIQYFETHDGMAVRDQITGELGYHTGNRYVIPVHWKNWKLDFIVSEHDFIQHAKTLDFTIGAMYFSLREKKMFYMNAFPPFADLNLRRIHTISNPYASFHQDPSLIFRGIRLCATESFYFSSECIEAINKLFFEENNNLFLLLKRGKLYQQLNLVLTSNYESHIWRTFFNMNLFYKLWDCLLTLPTGSGSQYISRLQHHLNTHSPKIFAAYQPGFFMVEPPYQTNTSNYDTTLNNMPSV